MSSAVIKINLTNEQIKKLKSGKSIQLKPYQLSSGKQEVRLTNAQVATFVKNRKGNKGMRLKMSKEQIGANPLLFALLAPLVEKGISNLVRGKNVFTGKGIKKKTTPRAKTTSKKTTKGKGMFLPRGAKTGRGMSVPRG